MLVILAQDCLCFSQPLQLVLLYGPVVDENGATRAIPHSS